MNQRDLVINAILLVLIVAALVLLISFRSRPLEPPSVAVKQGEEEPRPVGPETPVGVRPAISPSASVLEKIRPFDTLIPRPTPTPTPEPTPLPPPPLGPAMAQFKLIMMDPPRSVTLQETKTTELIEWKVGEKRVLESQRRKLEVTLKQVDPNEFKATFTAPGVPGEQEFIYRFFEEPQ